MKQPHSPNGIKKSWAEEKILKQVIDKFDVDRKIAEIDMKKCVQDLLKMEIIFKKKLTITRDKEVRTQKVFYLPHKMPIC